MPLFGVGLHILVALFFAVHAVRTNQDKYWLMVLFAFPGLGSVVYFFAIFMPQSRLERSIGKAGSAVLRSLDPGRDMREAQAAFELTPTAHNQVRLAQAMLAANMPEKAVEQFDACLRGPFAKDPEIVLGAAQAKLANQQPGAAIEMLLAVRGAQPGFRQEHVGLVLARAYAAIGRHDDAANEFADVVARFANIEARIEYALWAIGQGRRTVAEEQIKELAHTRKHLSRDSRALHAGLFKRLDAAILERDRLAQRS